MATQFLILSLLISCQALTSTKVAEDTRFVGSQDRETLGLEKKHKVSHFRFYFHETFIADGVQPVGGFQLHVNRREVQWQHHHSLREEPHLSEA